MTKTVFDSQTVVYEVANHTASFECVRKYSAINAHHYLLASARPATTNFVLAQLTNSGKKKKKSVCETKVVLELTAGFCSNDF